MSWLVRAFRTRERRHATVPLTLAVVVVALGVLLYLELVTTLLAYAG
jgi:asparagine N-glycosylation enzyme membrane subunit Stt3